MADVHNVLRCRSIQRHYYALEKENYCFNYSRVVGGHKWDRNLVQLDCTCWVKRPEGVRFEFDRDR
jgi:hypothetical protein